MCVFLQEYVVNSAFHLVKKEFRERAQRASGFENFENLKRKTRFVAYFLNIIQNNLYRNGAQTELGLYTVSVLFSPVFFRGGVRNYENDL